jgi:beta-N-acetylhexosaminidase
MKGKKISCFFWALCILFLQQKVFAQVQPSFLRDYNEKWVDSVFSSMTLDHKIGQLLMPRGNYSGKPHDIPLLQEWVEKYKIGGLVFFAGSATRQVEIVNLLQAKSDIPLLIGQDFEWGTAMRLDSTIRFPYALTLGAIKKEKKWLKEMGKEMGKHCKRLGVHVNYAPVADINNNPQNPVINFRSFGEDKNDVTEKALAIMQGLHENNIICTAKHFPGHGNTNVDSHHDLPVILASWEKLKENELYPFSELIKKGLSGIMTAHIYVPALDDEKNLPSTLSRKTITQLLRNEMGFEGLVFTDAMDMQGVIKNFSQGEAIVRALLAGNDIIETFLDVPVAVAAIKNALAEGRLTTSWLDFKVKKILKAKSWVGLDDFSPIPVDNLIQDLNTYESHVINSVLAENSATLLKNEKDLIPLKSENKKTALVSLLPTPDNQLLKMISNYREVTHFEITKQGLDTIQMSKLISELKGFDVVLAAPFLTQVRPSQKYGLNEKLVAILDSISLLPSAILLWLGNPYGLEKIKFNNYSAILTGYQETFYTQRVLGQAIFGSLPVSGKLPVSVHDLLPLESGINVEKKSGLSYGPGDLVGIDGNKLETKIDSMMEIALVREYFPGSVVQVTFKDKVVLQKSYGTKSYTESKDFGKTKLQSNNNVDVMDASTSGNRENSSIPQVYDSVSQLSVEAVYDLASVTKIAAATLAMMLWVQENKIKLDDSLYRFFPEYKSKPIGKATFRDLLTHRSGLQAWIPFWKTTIDSAGTLQKVLAHKPELQKYCVLKVKKPFFIARWFGKKSKVTVLIPETIIENKKELWDLVFTEDVLVWKSGYYSNEKRNNFTIQLADSLWLRDDYPELILKQISEAPFGEYGKYVYSDLHYYFYPKLCKKLTGQNFEDYLHEQYKKMGLSSLKFLPLKYFEKQKIVPTEIDSIFRKTLIHGLVHDEGAIMMGGVSGHAGLFGNANDLTRLMDVFLKSGKSGEEQFIDKKIVDEFTAYQFPDEKNRRGLGFDKKEFGTPVKNAPSLSGPAGFGHSGYTGTFTWVDPQHDLIIVFLSNRVHPTRKNQKINESLFRQKLCDAVYEVILNSEKN